MNASVSNLATNNSDVLTAINYACDSVAPTWPLDRMIAVNPYWQRIDSSFTKVAETLAEIAGSTMTMPMSYYLERWEQGDIQQEHLEQAAAETDEALSIVQLLHALDGSYQPVTPAPLLCDVLDGQRDLLHQPAWCDTITHQIAQFCAAYFDIEQADWRPDQQQALYSSWRESLAKDHSVALLMKAAHIPAKSKTLADDPVSQIEMALKQLGVEPTEWSCYLQAVLMRVSGWASWCAYRRWQARLADSDDNTLIDLLAIRLSWECLIDDGKRYHGSVCSLWHKAWCDHFQSSDKEAIKILAAWQRAHEISYQQQLFNKLTKAAENATAASAIKNTPQVQAVFCIDVRSEVFRRHFEAQSPDIQTLGFAGFFGLPISYTPLGTEVSRPQLPGLLAPTLNITESSGNAKTDKNASESRQHSLQNRFNLKPFQTQPLSSFTLVETLGLGYAAKLIKNTLSASGKASSPESLGLSQSHLENMRPSLKTALGDNLQEQANIAAQVLKGMGLVNELSPLVLLVGHGSQNQNNPHRAGLDCGACCGQTGEVNARALAGLLNDPQVRQQLKVDGIVIPEDTRFIAALHNTTTDEIKLFDTEEVLDQDKDALRKLISQLEDAGQAARQERAPRLGLESLIDKPKKLTKAVKQRANDWAQTRPEWGLANNAAFVVAPRSKTRGVNLAGRSFLHDYDYRKDADNSLLELIMTAPMVVTHWINMQYHASTVDNQRYGSGNKTLHNVVGGRLGVFEGNGGDLRIGLAKQSVHDGENWCHEPLRLTVVIDAPRQAIEAVIVKHPMVQNLLDNEWLYLARFEQDSIECYQQGGWQKVS